ncbi:MAG: CDP-diacylglycerol--serine O-phosphatidyltransferase [Chitinophagia bacterium]|nr:CDP-diacylglycerol--serine O-phosphatidyltransferase [Chitinophagia bacterium]
MKQIPNIFTLLNLLLGCLAIVCILQPGIIITTNEYGEHPVFLPENIVWASCCIGAAAVVDFLDGWVARWMKATSEIGAQLDSLSDVVSFGVAPGMIVYQFLRYAYAMLPNGLDVAEYFLLPAFLIPIAGAYRLARFNVTVNQKDSFTGVPIPAVGIWIASFPLINQFTTSAWQFTLIHTVSFWYFISILSAWLMVSKLPMLALKFSGGNTQQPKIPYLLALAVISIISAWLMGWMAVSVGFIAYVLLSLLYKKLNHDVSGTD